MIETEFRWVIINDKLKWQSYTSYLNSKLKCEIGKLHRIKSCVPKHFYKDIYHTLFESHLRYGISSWGGISQNKFVYKIPYRRALGLAAECARKQMYVVYKNKLKPLFFTQKKCESYVWR